MYKRIYSLNVVAYLYMKGLRERGIGIDEDNENIKYFIFDQTDEVNGAIMEYRNNVSIKSFIANYREVKDTIIKYKTK